MDTFPDLVAGLVQAVLGSVVVDPDVPRERSQWERTFGCYYWSRKPVPPREHLSASLHPQTVFLKEVVCVGNEESWQPRNPGVWQLAGGATAGNVHWAFSGRDGNGSVVSFHTADGVLQHQSLNRYV